MAFSNPLLWLTLYLEDLLVGYRVNNLHSSATGTRLPLSINIILEYARISPDVRVKIGHGYTIRGVTIMLNL